MSDQVHLVTGATSGIGRVAALACAATGATVVFVGRNEDKCRSLLAEMQEAGNDRCSYIVADLSRQADVRRVAEQFQASHDRLDLLLNNAGAVFTTRGETDEGIERTWALNHLAYFLLTNLLLDTLKASAPARIVSTASDAHRTGTMDFEDLEFKSSYPQQGFAAYCRSKLANIQFTFEISRRLEGTGVTAVAVHPGYVNSSFGLNNTGVWNTLFRLGGNLFARSEEKGARGLIHMSLSPDVEGVTGAYWMDYKQRRPTALASDEEVQRRLWEVSMTQTGLA